MITVQDIRQAIGLDEKEAKVYFALLELGGGYASVVAAEAGIQRSTVYHILEHLHDVGLVLKYIRGKKLYYAISHPKNLLQYLTRKETNIKSMKRAVNYLLPEMQHLHERNKRRPTLLYFDKKADVHNLMLEVLAEKGTNEVFAMLSLDIFQKFTNAVFMKKFAAAVKREETRLKVINFDDNDDAAEKSRLWLHKYFIHHTPQLTPKIKNIRSRKDLSKMHFITGNKVHLVDINPPDLMGIIIVNTDIAQGSKIIFENLWNATK